MLVSCLKLPEIVSVYPSEISSSILFNRSDGVIDINDYPGRINSFIVVTGVSFNYSSLRCRFVPVANVFQRSDYELPIKMLGSEIVEALIISDSVVHCKIPSFNPFIGSLELSVSSNGVEYSSSFTIRLLESTLVPIKVFPSKVPCDAMPVLAVNFTYYGKLPDRIYCRFNGNSSLVTAGTFISKEAIVCASVPISNPGFHFLELVINAYEGITSNLLLEYSLLPSYESRTMFVSTEGSYVVFNGTFMKDTICCFDGFSIPGVLVEKGIECSFPKYPVGIYTLELINSLHNHCSDRSYSPSFQNSIPVFQIVYEHTPLVTEVYPFSAAISFNTLTIAGKFFINSPRLSCKLGLQIGSATFRSSSLVLCTFNLDSVFSGNFSISNNGRDFSQSFSYKIIKDISIEDASLVFTDLPKMNFSIVSDLPFKLDSKFSLDSFPSFLVPNNYVSSIFLIFSNFKSPINFSSVKLSLATGLFYSSKCTLLMKAPDSSICSTSDCSIRCQLPSIPSHFSNLTFLNNNLHRDSDDFDFSDITSFKIKTMLVFDEISYPQFSFILTYYMAPTIISLYPSFGSIEGNTTITVNGLNIGRKVICIFDGIPVYTKFISAFKIACITPVFKANINSDVTFGIKSDAGNIFQVYEKTFNFAYVPAPVISTVSPRNLTIGYVILTVCGLNFGMSFRCFLGDFTAQSFFINSSCFTCDFSNSAVLGTYIFRISLNMHEYYPVHDENMIVINVFGFPDASMFFIT